jgi:hypothetical protein
MSQSDDQQTGPAEVLAARFDNREAAEAVAKQLTSVGYDPAELSYISDASKCSFTFDGVGNHPGRATLEGIAGGGAFGAAVSATASVAGLGSLVLLGPVGLAAGAVMGGVIGVMLGAGLNSSQAAACEAAIGDGSLVLAIQTHAGDQARVRSILGPHLIAAEEDTYRE